MAWQSPDGENGLVQSISHRDESGIMDTDLSDEDGLLQLAHPWTDASFQQGAFQDVLIEFSGSQRSARNGMIRTGECGSCSDQTWYPKD
ncbi:hypothetical protein CSOJ01_10028 [Colletotrichum sojae]|uniref:Uncharacterized protein n=1 Tax=Colletotrichum sojae TaxID=2175907 RepID=A0A8H6MPS9_9PEZI|nr:hypothetical protein CSOJ01_10028 [Colletotrichum sojae]